MNQSSGKLVVLVLLGASACTGTIGSAGTPGLAGSGGATAGGSGGSPMPRPDSEGNLPYVAPQPAPAALPARAWRLTHAEYRASVKDVTGIDVDTTNFEAEADGGMFANLSNVNFVRVGLASNYYDAAEHTADTITEARMLALAAPACAGLTTACKADFIKGALKRGYRRPATDAELAEAAELFDLAAAAGDAVLPFRAVIQFLLTSPFFLYRTEIGPSDGMTATSFRLTDHEVASLLSYSLLGQPPSSTLLGAAERGELAKADAAGLRSNVEALLKAPQAADPLRAFLFQWLTLNKVNDDLFKFPELFPGFDGVRTSMLDEANSFFTANAGMDGTLTRLLTAPVPHPSGALESFYTAPGAGAGTRVGWLALGGFLSVEAHANQSSPTLRGNFVRERLLCQHMTIPPGIPVLEQVEMMGGAPKSTRELYQMHQKPECAVCHQALDQVGFTFENFDGAGRFRTEELFRNQTTPTPIDTSGKLVNTDVNRPLRNQGDLAEALAQSAWVRECAAIQAFRYTFGFGDEVPRGLPPVMAGYQALSAGGTMRDLLTAVASSPTTVERTRN